MKKAAFAPFIAFCSSVLTLFAIALLQAPATANAAAPDTSEARYTLEEVARHNKPDDCWMAIKGQVYDFSTYIPDHPAPAAIIAAWCGKEATEGMSTKGYGRDHSPMAWSLMESYLIGSLATP